MSNPKPIEHAETYAKQSRLWLNAVLLLIILALAVLLWLKPSGDESSTVLVDLSPSEVRHIHITQISDGEERVIALKKEAKTWYIETSPQPKKVKPEKVAQVLTLLGETSLSQYPVAGRDLAQYQLQPGLLKVSFNSIELIFGMTNPVNYQRYILQDKTIHLVNESVFATLNNPVAQWLVSEQTSSETETIKKESDVSDKPVKND